MKDTISMQQMFKTEYVRQVQLLLQTIPFVAAEKCFAIKGGTAINLFLLDMPRLSVDIDLTYLPLQDRTTALLGIDNALLRMKKAILSNIPNTSIGEKRTNVGNHLSKLYVSNADTQIIIEPNLVLRGNILPIIKADLCATAEDYFEMSLSDIPILSVEELYAGKICAALDRQHPRDLFDVKILLENSGITDNMRHAFVVYLASNSRPMHELLAPNILDIEKTFASAFAGMILDNNSVRYEELLEARVQLIEILQKSLTQNEREFLLSIKLGDPQWDLMSFDNLDQLPAIQWKLINIKKMDKKKHNIATDNLKRVLCL
ncbi:MAG: hypothetical protein COB50_04290 [Thiotrichales bacterium]|nr:MAG: hypothetical protein COB50_04290 [Thiotrichales bacterium]